MKVFYTKTYNVWNDNTRKHDIVVQAAKKLDYDEVSLFKFNDTYDSDDELRVRMQGITAAVSGDSIVISSIQVWSVPGMTVLSWNI